MTTAHLRGELDRRSVLDLVDPAPIGRRTAALAVDVAPLLVLAGVGIVLHRSTVWWIVLGAGVAYVLAEWIWGTIRGQGPGKAVTGLRVVDQHTGRTVGAARTLVRQLARIGLGLITLGIGGLSYRWDPAGREQTWWDRIARTRVIAAATAPAAVAGPDGPERQRWAPQPRPPVPTVTPSDLDPAPLLQRPPRMPDRPIGPGPVAPPLITAVPKAPSTVPPPPAIPPDELDLTVARTIGIGSTSATLLWDSGRSILITGRVLVGRDPMPEPGEQVNQALAVDVDSRGVSKTHLAIDVTATGIAVTDRHSTNGVLIVRPDGSTTKIPAGQPIPVREGDRIEFGGRSLTVAG